MKPWVFFYNMNSALPKSSVGHTAGSHVVTKVTSGSLARVSSDFGHSFPNHFPYSGSEGRTNMVVPTPRLSRSDLRAVLEPGGSFVSLSVRGIL